MNRAIESVFTPPDANAFQAYVRPNVRPPLDPNRLSLELMVGEERDALKSITSGDWSFVLRYKGREAYLASFEESQDDEGAELRLIQLQGASSRGGYRVATGMDTLLFIADQVEKLATDPESSYTLLTMPPAVLIAGIRDATESAITAYERAAIRLGMSLTPERDLFVRELK